MIKNLPAFPAIFILSLFLMVSCATKKMMKQAEDFESAGMFRDAAELYYKAWQKKPGKAEIKIALKRSAQLAFENMSSDISSAYSRGEYKEVVYKYMEARSFSEKMETAGIRMNIPLTVQRQFDDASDYYLEEQYQLGLKYLSDESYEKAREIFSEISDINPDYQDTQRYLDQATYEPVYREAAILFQSGRYMQAYDKWAWIYNRNPGFKDVGERMDQALHERYREGSIFLMNENFDDAAEALGDVYRINPDFEDVNTQYIEARSEPVYRQAKTYLQQDKCRTAYFDFKSIIDDAGSYKDTRTLMEKALECAQYPVAVHTPLIRGHITESAEFEDKLIKELLDRNDPFLKIYDLTSIDKRIDRMVVDRTGNIDKEQLEQLYDRHRIKAVLLVSFLDFEKLGGKPKAKEKTGFERELVKTTTGETSYRDKLVSYMEYAQENLVEMDVSFKLINTENGEILLSDSYSDKESDEMNYARYDGNRQSLYPAIKINDTWSVNENKYNKLQSLLQSDGDIMSIDRLQERLFDNITGKMANNIHQFNPEK